MDFDFVHFVEKWGRGIELILSKEPDTSFRELAGIFITTFRRKNFEKGVEKLSEVQRLIINIIHENPKISKKGIRIIGKITKKSVEYNIDSLKKKGLLKRIGPDKGGHWEVRQP